MSFLSDVAGSPFVLVVIAAGIMLAISYGYYSRSGGDITQRPHDGRGQAPGAEGHSSVSTTDDDVERTIGTHGTR